MKRITTAGLIVLPILLVAAAAAAFVQTRRAQGQAREIAELQIVVKQMEAERKTDAETIAALQRKTEMLNAESAQLRGRLHAAAEAQPEPDAAAKTAAAGAETDGEKAEGGDKKNNPFGFIEKMLKDPQMKKAMAAQSSFAMRQFYTDFIKTNHLTPEEADRFYKALGDRQMALMDSTAEILGDKDGQAADSAKPADPKAKKEAAEQPLAEILGPQRFAQFQEYEKTLPDRMQINQLNQQLSASGAPLQPFQTDGLMRIIADERTKQPSPFAANDPAALSRTASMSDADLDDFTASQQQLNERVRARAASLLNPQQMSALEAYQKQSIEAQKLGLKMARDMMKSR